MILKSFFGSRLSKGDPAPEFGLVDQSGKVHRLVDYKGRWFVIYFYPKDGTMLCTQEACSFRDEMSTFESLDVPVLGVSADSVESHQSFAQKHRLNFALLADIKREAAKAYGVLSPLGIVNRVTFLVNPEGRIADVIEWASWSTYSKSVIDRIHAARGTST